MDWNMVNGKGCCIQRVLFVQHVSELKGINENLFPKYSYFAVETNLYLTFNKRRQV